MAIDMGNTKVQLVAALEGFEDDELFVPEDVFTVAGAFVEIASNDITPAHGVHDGDVEPDIAIWRIDVPSLDALVIAGGRGAMQYLWANPQLLDKVREANAKGKVIGAIGMGVVVLAQAGVLKGKRATASPEPMALSELRRHGANYEDVDAATDDNIVTARGTEDAKMFAELILGLLKARLTAPQH